MPAKYCTLLIFIVLGCCPVASCSNPSGPAPIADTTDIKAFRIIIGFTENLRMAPENPRLIAGLEYDLSCRLEYLHAIAQTHVYICYTSENEKSLISHLNKLEQRDDIQYAELDRKRRINAQ